MPQSEINERLVELARAGKAVVRLKGGDPFVFGRGGEEAEALAEAGVPFEVVPGVTAGVAGPAYAGIPVTHRDAASAVAFVTGHEDPDKPEPAIDWEALARFPGTLVFYMGVKNLPRIAERLRAAGRAHDEAAAVIARATLPTQQVVQGTLADIAARAEDAGLQAPAITVVGPVAELRDTLAWLERRPLHGRTVAVTRARAQASELAARLALLGAEVVETPAIRIEPRRGRGAPHGLRPGLRDEPQRCRAADGRAARRPRPGRRDGRRDRARHRGGAAAARHRGRRRARALGRRGARRGARGRARGGPAGAGGAGRRGARRAARRAARARCASVDVVELYDTLPEPLSEEQRAALRRASYVTFTSSSTVRFFMQAVDGLPDRARIASIGPVTSATAREHGLEVHVEAERHDIDGLVEALVRDAAGPPPSRREGGRP